MTTHHDTKTIERLIMHAIKPVIGELLLVDLADFVVYLTLDQHNLIADIVDSAVEQYFAPGFIGYREAGSATIEWDATPSILLQMSMNAPSHHFEFSLILEAKAALVKLLQISPLTPGGERDLVEVLERTIEVNSVRSA